MKVVAFLNEKGGVGKTTLATHLAAGLAALGHRVLLVDADAQGHTTRFYNLPKTPGLYRFLVERVGYTDVIQIIPPEVYTVPDHPPGLLALLPSDIETRNIFTHYPGTFDYFDAHLRHTRAAFDYCIVDTGPAPGDFHKAIYLAADSLLLPIIPEYFSLDSLNDTLAHVGGANTLRQRARKPPLQTFIIPTLYRSRLVEHTENMALLHEHYAGIVWPPIRDRVHWKETIKYHQPIFALLDENASDATKDCWEMVRQFLEVFGETQG